jgi:putative oxidoreductase
MNTPDVGLARHAAAAPLGRLLMGAIFVTSGVEKLSAAGATIAGFTKLGLPLRPAAFTLAVLVEAGIGFLVIIGFCTRSAALVLAFWCIAAAIVAHSNFADRNMLIRFHKTSRCAEVLSRLRCLAPVRSALTHLCGHAQSARRSDQTD